MSKSKTKILEGYQRHDIFNLLEGEKNIAMELGVAKGVYSKRMVDSGKFSHVHAVDMYADNHNTREYKNALKKVGLEKNYYLYRMKFEEAYDLFPDQYFDFVYVDGYAKNGELGGETIFKWYNKVKIGGILAGDDYDKEEWPLVYEAVNEFIRQTGYELMVTGQTEDIDFCKYPTWCVRKTDHQTLELPLAMIMRGKSIISNPRYGT